jgi:hypothetical protein
MNDSEPFYEHELSLGRPTEWSIRFLVVAAVVSVLLAALEHHVATALLGTALVFVIIRTVTLGVRMAPFDTLQLWPGELRLLGRRPRRVYSASEVVLTRNLMSGQFSVREREGKEYSIAQLRDKDPTSVIRAFAAAGVALGHGTERQ